MASSCTQCEIEMATQSYDQRPKCHLCRRMLPMVQESLIDHFPVEIASRVFAFSLQLPETTRKWTKNQKQGPLILGAVSRSWRAIAWTTPQLWTSIWITVSPETIALRTELAKEWLARSGQLPLTIVISWQGSSEHGALIQPLINTINEFASRWRTLDIALPFTSLFRFIGNPWTPQLEELSIFHCQALKARQYNPRARKTPVRWRQELKLHLPLGSVHWDNLTRLCADGLFLDECLEIFTKAPHLKCCNFTDLVRRGEGFAIPNNPIILNRLRELSFSCSSGARGSQGLLLSTLALKSLEELKLDFEPRILQDALLSLSTHASCPLRRFQLTLCGSLGTEEALVELLPAIPPVQHLIMDAGYIRFRCITDLFFSHLDPLNLPQLQIFDYLGHRHFSWKTLAGFATSFHSSGSSNSQPRTIRIHLHSYECYIDKESLSSLLHLRNAGLHIIITSFGIGSYSSDTGVDEPEEVDMLEVSKEYHNI